VIGETAVIGERVRLYQAVTLGAKSFPVDAEGNPVKGQPRHPVLEDDVVIYAGATVLGRVTIGRGSSVGGNVWLTHSVPPASHITQAVHRQRIPKRRTTACHCAMNCHLLKNWTGRAPLAASQRPVARGVGRTIRPEPLVRWRD